jgi:quercetin dioxygenase-like cupin family protein
MSVLHVAAEARTFIAWGEGSEVSVLRGHDSGGLTTLTRFFKGAHGQYHSHPGGEELYVISGKAMIGETLVETGDYLYTAPGAGHSVEAFEDTLLLIVLPLAPDYSAQAPSD